MIKEQKLIYLDNNATTKVDEKVLEKMLPYFCEKYGNPSSMYSFAKETSNAIKKAREQVMTLFGASEPSEIFFTASGSECASTAIRGMLSVENEMKHIVTTKVEHPCVLNLYKYLEKQGYKVSYLSVNTLGELDLNELKSLVSENTALVSCMFANNETGMIYPVEELAEIVKSINPKTKVYVDAVQAAGKIPLNIKDTQIDMMGVSGHKFHAPKGIGALYARKGTKFAPLILGGHQERGQRAGTENVPYIVGIGEAANLAVENLFFEGTQVKYLRDKLENAILKNIFNSRLNSSIQNRVPNTSNIGFEYIEGELILLHLSDLGICASSGSACTSGSLDASHVLKAMNVPFTSLHGSIRFSLSRYNTEDEIDYVISTLPAVIEKITQLSPFQKEIRDLKIKKGLLKI